MGCMLQIILVIIMVVSCEKSGNDQERPFASKQAKDFVEKIVIKKGKLQQLSAKEKEIVKDTDFSE